MSADPITFDAIHWIGRNEYGWRFGIGRTGGRWIGFGVSRIDDGSLFLNVFPEVSAGPELGLPDTAYGRDAALRYTAALAQDPEHGFGGIAAWEVPPELRVRPEALRCRDCGRIHPGDCEPDYDDGDLDDEP